MTTTPLTYAKTRDWPEIPVPVIPRHEVETVYSFGHYDGPRSGLVKWRDAYWYVKDFSVSDYGERYYWIITLTPKEQEYALRYGAAWAEFFSSSMSWRPDGHRMPLVHGKYAEVIGKVEKHTKEGRDLFNNEFPARPAPSEDADVVGYIESWSAY